MRFVGVFREWARREELELRLGEPATVRRLLQEIGEALGPEFRDKVLEDLARREYVSRVLLINGKNALTMGGEDARLSPGDTVTFVPPMEGG
ncbi:MAG: MoaD/ThiS family protein [Bacillota bacterium]